LEQTLRELPRIGTLVKDRGYRQIWRFEHGGRAYYLKFYLRGGGRDAFRRLARGSPAVLEFTRLQMLQKAKIPSPRAVAVLVGFKLQGRDGDAVILEAIEPSVQLDHYFNELELRGEPIPDHLDLSRQIRELIQHMAAAKLGHQDLHLGNLLLHDGRVFLLDGYAVRRGALRLEDLFFLGHSTNAYATRTDLLRAWDLLASGTLPQRNPLSPRIRGEFLNRIGGGNRYFGRLRSGAWGGVFFRTTKFAHRWSAASRLTVEEEDWRREWPPLLRQIEADELQVLKRTRSGDVLAGEVTLGGQTVPIVVKRPRRRYWYRYLNEIGRGSRAWRGWVKAWNLILRNLPTAWPLIVMDKRKLGYVTDSIIVYERVPGPTMHRVDLDAMDERPRDMLFRRLGRVLRKIDQTGLSHFDAKASNWIVLDDPAMGATPVLVDADGVRFRRWTALGIQRLLRSMKEHQQYTVQDSLALCRGYAPWSPLRQEPAEVPAVQAAEG